MKAPIKRLPVHRSKFHPISQLASPAKSALIKVARSLNPSLIGRLASRSRQYASPPSVASPASSLFLSLLCVWGHNERASGGKETPLLSLPLGPALAPGRVRRPIRINGQQPRSPLIMGACAPPPPCMSGASSARSERMHYFHIMGRPFISWHFVVHAAASSTQD